MNYQRVLDETLKSFCPSDRPPRLLLHSCCGPCSSYVLEYLSEYFEITVLYYNPNIWPEIEFSKRADTQRELLARISLKNPVTLVVADYKPEAFDEAAAGLENEPEGGKRCLRCFELRLEAAAAWAKAHGFDYLTTTLSVSPHKDAAALNALGGMLAEKYGVRFLYADFKKRNGYRRSVELSALYDLYRQSYCGCRFSLRATAQVN